MQHLSICQWLHVKLCHTLSFLKFGIISNSTLKHNYIILFYLVNIFEEWNRYCVKYNFWLPFQNPLVLPFAPATNKGISFTQTLQTQTGSISPKVKHCLGVYLMVTHRYLENCSTLTLIQLRSDPAINCVGPSFKRWRGDSKFSPSSILHSLFWNTFYKILRNSIRIQHQSFILVVRLNSMP